MQSRDLFYIIILNHKQMCLSETFSSTAPFTFMILIPFLLYYSFAMYFRQNSSLKELPNNYEYKLPEFLVSAHVDKSKYIRRQQKRKQYSRKAEQKNSHSETRPTSPSSSRKYRFLGCCDIGLQYYAQLNQRTTLTAYKEINFVYKKGLPSSHSRNNATKLQSYGYQPTQLTIIHENAQY